VASRHPAASSAPRAIRVRTARVEDLAWVRDLAVRSVVHGIPEGRGISPEEVQDRARALLADLEDTLQDDPDRIVLVACESACEGDTGRRLGYLMLDLDHREAATGEPQALIRDVAVEPDDWGRHVPHHLVREAARRAHHRGLHHLAGEVTASNRRALVQALRLGFTVERYQIAAACGPEGLIPRLDAQERHRPGEIQEPRL